MCDDHEHSAAEAAWSAPRAAQGTAVDPVTLPEVDEVAVTTMVDNTFDALLASGDGVSRAPRGAERVAAAQFTDGETIAGLRAEHGFSALVTVRSGNASSTLLFDTGASPDALAVNAGRLGIDVGDLQGVERRQPSLLAGGILITGEVDRVTEFEHGMPPPHQACDGHGWRHDPLVIDDQALVVNVRGRGLVITGCGHAGVVNIIRHAMRLTGVGRLLAVIGGFHLSGSAFEPVIAPTVAAPTVAALAELAPELIAPGHCTGWRAQHTLAATLPDAWVQSSVGTTYTLSAA